MPSPSNADRLSDARLAAILAYCHPTTTAGTGARRDPASAFDALARLEPAYKCVTASPG